MDGKLITADYTKVLRKAYLSMDLREYLIKSNKWKNNIIDKIWWEGYENSINSINPSKKRFIQKFVHKKLPTNYRQNKYYDYKTSLCSQCNEEIETQEHMIRCTGCRLRTGTRKKYILDLENIMEKHRINKSTTMVIKHCVNKWLHDEPSEYIDKLVPDASYTLKRAYKEQSEIGWDNWMKGRISIEWGTLVNHDIKNQDSLIKYNSSEKWAREIILLNWDFAYSIWNLRNKNEHDLEGKPELRAKEKILDEILGISKETEYSTYSRDELRIHELKQSPMDNLKIILLNIKNERARRTRKKKLKK
jgi:hypothetical protein